MPPRVVGLPAPAMASKIIKKERILQALSRMNDRDTQKAAAEDLVSIITNMDQEGLPIVLSCLCTTGSEHKVYARKECARAVGIIASEACPLREQAMQQPHLGKMLGQLRKSLQDPDSGVREASAESLALVAQGFAQLGPSGMQGNPSSPVVKLLFDCLVEQKKELNTAACTALGLAAPYLGTLDASLARDLVRKLNSPSFQAPSALLAALARTDNTSGEPVGLIKSGPAVFMPLLLALVGQPAQPALGGSSAPGSNGGSGVVGALSRPEWPVRMAAADMLRATAQLLGPLMEMEGCWTAGDAKSVTGRAMRGLELCRFDKVRDVREVARSALGVYEVLHEYGSAGGSAAGWPAHMAQKLYGRDLPLDMTYWPGAAAAPAPEPSVSRLPVPGRKSPVPRTAVSPNRRVRGAQLQPRASHSPPRRSPTPPERRSSPSLNRDNSVCERFRAAHHDTDEVAVQYPGCLETLDGEQEPVGQQETQIAETLEPPIRAPIQAWPQDDTLAAGPPGDQVLTQPSTQPMIQPPTQSSSSACQPQAAAEPLFSVRDPVNQPARDEDPSLTLQQLLIEDVSPTGRAADGPPAFSGRMAGRPSVIGGVPQGPRASAPSVSGSIAAPSDGPAITLPPSSAATLGLTVTVPTQEWLGAQHRLRTLEMQQQQLLGTIASISEQSNQAIVALEAKVRMLEAALEVAQAQLAASSQQAGRQDVPEDPDVALLSRTIRPGGTLLPAVTSASSGAGADQPPTYDQRPSLGPLPQFPSLGQLARPKSYGIGRSFSSEWHDPGPQDPADDVLSAAAGGTGLPGSSDVRQAYREALSSGRLSGMHLMRLMQRTGPIWNDLGHDLATQLLAAFTTSLQLARADGPMLSRVMPWLWRLADDASNHFQAPYELRLGLLAALRAVQPSVTDPTLHERVALLISTLRTHWSLSDHLTRFSQPNVPTYLNASPTQYTPVLPQPLPSSNVLAVPQSSQPYRDIPATQVAAEPKAEQRQLGGASAIASGGRTGSDADMGEQSGTLKTPPESGSPLQDAPSATPWSRLAAVRASYGRTPSINTLMGQWSDLQRDFAAMSSPAKKAQARTTGQ